MTTSTAAIRVTGATRLYAIVGDPIEQVRSPEVFSERFAAAGIDAVLIPAHVPAKDFDRAIAGMMALGNLDGLLVTVPFKARMLPFADRLGATAACIGALNALRREADGTWTGDMFDGTGFVRGAERKGQRVRGRRVTLFGAGGAGSAIACALAEAGAASVDIVDADAARAEALAGKLAAAFAGCRVAAARGRSADTDMIVNASPVGMRPGDGLPGDFGALSPQVLIGDVVISPTHTAVIRHAEAHGCAWVNGRDMHGGQVEALIAFLGPRPTVDARAPSAA